MVRKIFIYTIEEVKRLSPMTKLPVNEDGNLLNPHTEVGINTEDQSSIVGSGC